MTITANNIKTATADQLDEIMERTEYTVGAVAIGEKAAADQDLRNAAWAEMERRQFDE